MCEGIVFVRRSRNALLRGLSLRARRWLTYGFVKDEARSLRGVRYNPAGLVPDDHDMIDFFRWVAALPQATLDPIHAKTGEGDYEDNARSSGAPGLDRRAGVVSNAAVER
jgi:hypothetical protein